MSTPNEKDNLKKERRSSDFSGTAVDHTEEAPRSSAAGGPRHLDKETAERLEQNQKIANPLAGVSREQLARMGEEYCRDNGINDEDDIRAFRIGAMIAGDMNKYDTVPGLTAEEKEVIDRETTHKWSNPGMLYWVIVSK